METLDTYFTYHNLENGNDGYNYCIYLNFENENILQYLTLMSNQKPRLTYLTSTTLQ